MKRFTLISVVLLTSLSIYAGSYVMLSLGGRYEPAGIGLNGVKWYAWAPSGFVSQYRWRRQMMIAYAPLYWLDNRVWHTHDDAESGRYPINEVRPEDIGKVYQANGF